MRSILKRTPEGVELDLIALIQTIWRKLWIVIFVSVLCAVAFLSYTFYFVEPTYVSSISMYVNSQKTESEITINDLTASTRLVETYKVLITSKRVIEDVIRVGNLDNMSVGEVVSKISTESIDGTEFFKINVVDTDPVRSAKIANAIGDVIPDVISEMMTGSTIYIVDRAEIPTRPSSPNYKRNLKVGVAIGIVLSVIFIILWELLDTTFKSESELQEWNYPLLGVIPDLKNARKENYSYGKK